MQKYKLKQESCLNTKSSKHPITTITSNKSLIKHSHTNQNKSTLSLINNTDSNQNKSLNNKTKSSKHLETHTFTNNTHQNSVNIHPQSNSHNNSKSNHKSQNQKKKSTTKKLTSLHSQSKLLAQTSHGRSSSQYQNLSIPHNHKNQVSKNYKNIIKNRKQIKQNQLSMQQKDQANSKSNKNLKNQNHQKSINVSSFEQLKKKKTQKSRSKSKQFQNVNKKSNQSKKHLLTEPSHSTSKQNNLNYANQKKSQLLKKVQKLKQKGLIVQNFQSKKEKQRKLSEFQAEQYERFHFYMLKSSTNSEIQFSNADENTVKQLINQQKITNKAYFEEGQLEDIIFLKQNQKKDEEMLIEKKQSNKLSKRHSKMNLQLSSQCLNCLTEPQYSIQPKGIRHANNLYHDQDISSSKHTSQFSSKPQRESSKRQLSKLRQGVKGTIHQQLLHKSATVIQKVWRGYLTRKLLERFIEEEEIRLFERMKEIDQRKRQDLARNQKSDSQNFENNQQISEDQPEFQPISVSQNQEKIQRQENISVTNQVNLEHNVNISVNNLDYESEILPRDEAETISFIVQLNGIGSKHTDVSHFRSHSQKLPNESADQVLYTSVQSIDHLSKVQNIHGLSQDFIVNPINQSEFLKDSSQHFKYDENDQKDQIELIQQQELNDQKVQEQSQSFDEPIQNAQQVIQEQKQFRPNFFKNDSEQLKKYNFFNNNDSKSYQQSSYNEPSSIFYRPSRNIQEPSSFNKFSSGQKNQGDSYQINDQEESNIKLNRLSNIKNVNQEESSFFIEEYSEMNHHQKNLQQNSPQQKSLFNQFSQNNSQSQQKNQNQQQIFQTQKNPEQSVIQQNQTIHQYYKNQTQQLKVELKSDQKVKLGSLVHNKSNPNIFVLKSPKHQSLSKQSFSLSKSNKKNTQQQANKQKLRNTSSLKQFFFKKSLLRSEIQQQNQFIDLPIPTFSNQKLNFLAFPTQKQASSIESLLHFRHQCLTHQHSAQFKEIQQLLIKQKISKEDFIHRLQKLAYKFQESVISIKEAEKDIFNGYKALLKLIKDVLKDCKSLGYSHQKGNNVRFCRSMEIFLRDKQKMNQKCIFDDEYLWRFDEVMIDELDKSKKRLLQQKNGLKSQESEKKSKEIHKDIKKSENKVFSQLEQPGNKKQGQNLSSQKASKNNVALSPVLGQKQLSRQSLSHHQLPQFIMGSKSQSQISKNQDIKNLNKQNKNSKDVQKQTHLGQGHFDISELGQCQDDYYDEDDLSERNKVLEFKKTQNVQIKQDKYQNDEKLSQGESQSESYDIKDSDSLLKQEEKSQSKQEQIQNTQRIKKSWTKFQDYSQNLEQKSQYFQQSPQCQLQSLEEKKIQDQNLLRSTQFQCESNDIRFVINFKIKQFSEKKQDEQNLLDSDEAQMVPVIKREVYQLSLDSDSSEQLDDCWQAPQKPKQKQQQLLKIQPNRAHSVSLYQNQQVQQDSQLSKKYSYLNQTVQKFIIWQFIEEIFLNKYKPQSKTMFGKKITQIAQNIENFNPYINCNKNDNILQENNIIVISNQKAFQRTKNNQKLKNQTQKLPYRNKESVLKISNEEINLFLSTLYKNFPSFQQNKSKLSQKMYPSPMQLLRSLRDSSMEDYFYKSLKKRQKNSSSYSQQSIQNQNDNAQCQEQFSQECSSNLDSQTSYLELGSYEFLLSQELCESLIQKYISQVYDIQMDRKIKAEKDANIQMKTLKLQLDEYLQMKDFALFGILKNNPKNENVLSPSRIPKQGNIQSIIRTRELFLEHKEIQSQMLRKQILKIELHTILDSMNEELIKQRESKSGYSGIGLSELCLGVIERTGLQISTPDEYDTLCSKAKYRLQKFVLNEEVNLNDKLLLECQQSVTINDSQWVFYVTQALQFGLQITRIIQELLWEQVTRQFSKIKLKRKFRLDGCRVVQAKKEQVEKIYQQDITKGNPQMLTKGKKVISINIVGSSQESYNETQRQFKNEQQADLQVIQTFQHQMTQVQSVEIPQTSPRENQGQLKSFYQEEQQNKITDARMDDSHERFQQKQLKKNETESFCYQENNSYQKQQGFKSYKIDCQDEESYQLDHDSLEFDQQLDKQLEQMNQY